MDRRGQIPADEDYILKHSARIRGPRFPGSL
jgi:hypothetical protein